MIKPTVSIITPNYNNEKYIRETAESIFVQTYSNWEWIVVDDGSTDKGSEVLKEYAKQDSRIRYFDRDRKPKGPSTCRNIGIEKCNGEFLIFLDGDDLLGRFCLERRIEFMTQEKHLDFAVFAMKQFWFDIHEESPIHDLPSENLLQNLAKFVCHDFPWAITSPIWKTDFMRKINGFDEQLMRTTDPDMHVRALLTPKVKFKIAENEKADCYYRQRNRNENTQWMKNVIDGRIIFQKKIFSYINDLNIDKKTKRTIQNALKAGLLELNKKWIVIRVVHFKDIFYSHLNWAHNNKLITHKNYYLLLLLGKLWENEKISLARIFRLKGILYKLVR